MEFAASAAVAPADSVSIGAFFEVGHVNLLWTDICFQINYQK